MGLALREALEPERRRHAESSEGKELAAGPRTLEEDSGGKELDR